RWILSRLSAAAVEVTRNLEAFRFHEAAESAYHFFRGELADWYLELIKPRMQTDAGAASRGAAKATLVHVLDGALRLLHPVMPYITEALWLRLPAPAGIAREDSLVIARWPGAAPRDEIAEAQMDALMELIGAVRALRSEHKVPADSRIRVHLTNPGPSLRDALSAEERAVRRMARVDTVTVNGGAEGMGAHAVLRSGADLFLPLADVIDVAQERQRLGRELERVEGQLQATEARLASEQFAARAPAEIVAREREKADSLRDQRDRLRAKLRDFD
ncbi:MAG: class I tRNA ligase family protein, partial [Longimicrobiales bacterium]